jgi:hypothetical protein
MLIMERISPRPFARRADFPLSHPPLPQVRIGSLPPGEARRQDCASGSSFSRRCQSGQARRGRQDLPRPSSAHLWTPISTLLPQGWSSCLFVRVWSGLGECLLGQLLREGALALRPFALKTNPPLYSTSIHLSTLPCRSPSGLQGSSSA